MSPSCLACTVRGCGLPLEPRSRAYACANGHSFDMARAGYLNLLQPQDRRSREPGDPAGAVEARERLLGAGIGRQTIDGIVIEATALALTPASVVADLGAGTGALLAAIADCTAVEGIGIDISVTAVERAARHFPALTWVVANADRRLPLVDGCAALITSLHARRHPAECARVLADGGVLFVAVPAVDDLHEIRSYLDGHATERDRADGVIAEHAHAFRLVRRLALREQHHLERERLLHLLSATYRGGRHSAAARVETLDALTVTMSSDLLIFAKR